MSSPKSNMSGEEKDPLGAKELGVPEEVKKEAQGEVLHDPSEQLEQALEHVLYPGGGNFNKLRKKQVFLNTLLEDSVDGYIQSNSKRHFVKEEILAKIPGGLKVHSKERGHIYEPSDTEAFDRISQKLRDIKKKRLSDMSKKQDSRISTVPRKKPRKGTYSYV